METSFFTVSKSRFDSNGAYCDPDILARFLPGLDEAEFAQGVQAEADIPGPVTGTPDNACFEREVDLYDDGSVEAYEFGIDVDDGFDIDEAGPGSIEGLLHEVEVRGNLDEGIDFDEEDAGGVTLTLTGGLFAENGDDGVKVSEEDDGGLMISAMRAVLEANGGKGAVFEEEDAGDVEIDMRQVASRDNDDGEDTGLEVVEEDDGVARLTLTETDLADGFDAAGVTVRQ